MPGEMYEIHPIAGGAFKLSKFDIFGLLGLKPTKVWRRGWQPFDTRATAHRFARDTLGAYGVEINDLDA